MHITAHVTAKIRYGAVMVLAKNDPKPHRTANTPSRVTQHFHSCITVVIVYRSIWISLITEN